MANRAILSNPVQPETKDVDLWSLIHPFLTIQKDRIAFICKKTDQTLTYGDVYDKCLRWANFMEELFPEKSPTTVIFTSNHGMFPIMSLGTFAAGGIICPIMENYQEELVAFIFKSVDVDIVLVEDYLVPLVQIVNKRLNINPKIFITGKCHDPALSFDAIVNSSKVPTQPHKKIDPGSTAAMIFSSGTTGEPKGILHTHRGLGTIGWEMRESFFFKYGHKDGSQNFFTTSYPIAHIGSLLLFCIIPLLNGDGSIVLDFNDFDEINEALVQYKIKLAFLRPFSITRLVQLPNAEKILSSVEIIVTVGSNPEIQSELLLLKRAPHIQFKDAYGLTETIVLTKTPDTEDKIMEGTIPVAGVTLQIRDQTTGEILEKEEKGVIVVKSQWLMKEYLNKPEATREIYTEDGFLITGDIGYISKEGRLMVMGREKDVMVVDGRTVLPSVIEENLSKHPSVLEVAVIGTPDANKGQIPKAFVISKEKSTSSKELEDFCDSQTKHPEEKLLGGVKFVNELPRNGLGKVLKKELRRIDWGEGS